MNIDDSSASLSDISGHHIPSCPDVTGWLLSDAEAMLRQVWQNEATEPPLKIDVVRTAPPERKPQKASTEKEAPATVWGEWRVLRWSVIAENKSTNQSTFEATTTQESQIVHTIEIVAARELVAAPDLSPIEKSI